MKLLTTNEVKEAKKFCTVHGLNPKQVTKEIGDVFWEEVTRVGIRQW